MSRMRFPSSVLTVAAAGALLLPSLATADPHAVTAPKLAGVAGLPGPVAAPSTPSANPKLLAVTPASGTVGTKFTVAGAALPANKPVEIVWSTSTVRYILNPQPENVEYHGRQFDKTNVVLAHADTDGAGRFSVDLTAPEDFGDVHDIYAVIGGVQVAKAGFQINRVFSVSPASGPIGTPITIKVTGLGSLPYTSTAAVLYDNGYAGMITATTTRGSAEVHIRASGPIGTHPIELAPASAGVPYLDIEQSAVAYVGKYRTTFRVTADNGAPRPRVELPAAVQPTEATRTTFAASTATGVTASMSSQSGIIHSKVSLTAKGLQAGAPAVLQWLTAVGTRATASGWTIQALPLGQATVGSDGSLNTNVSVPDALGGWHTLQVVQGGAVKAQLPYYVLRSFVSATPQKVKAGDTFSIHLKGIGWTELDNTTAVTYDNKYIGYACGFYSQGDINMNLVATGAPGTHLIDLYPTVYRGKVPAADTWLEHMPQLSFLQDAPGLALGYRLPAIHLAITVTK